MAVNDLRIRDECDNLIDDQLLFQSNIFVIQSSGNMRVPSMLNVFMCVLDIIFNTIFIFPTREVSFLGMSFTMYGAGMEVAGAALGTALAIAVTSLLMSSYLCFKSK